ncbi:putative flavin carrier protein 3 [Fusarium torreyae]|uniref:Flavin carrier protein 3 n=1 Tax=Fusarium torreyae TaxID=1237075 RepID=A0A9W8VCC8_9HYPO|nr:putative flavin carrier protein 3 [Fusarium torreyae]
MKLLTAYLIFLSWLTHLLPFATADKILESKSLNSCQQGSLLTASLFHVVITPNNSVATINVNAVASVQGKVIFDVALDVYGHQFTRQIVNPCQTSLELPSLCPMTPGDIDIKFTVPLGDALDQVPGIAYGIPDLDATVRAFVNLTSTGESVACVEADFSTGKTVEQLSVKWVTAIIIGIGLISSALISLAGYGNAAAHLAANTLSLFSYFQAQAIIGLTGITMPPIVDAWTQNFQWSMGIIRLGWMQTIFTWYQRATGGTPARIFDHLATASVQVAKRSLEYLPGAATLARRSFAMTKRANIELENGSFLVYGIQRVAFRSRIETTNLFLTALVFFIVFIIFACILVLLCKFALDLCARQAWIKQDRFLEFRTEWRTLLKGILLRLTLMGFPPLTILCLWEFTQADSPALVVLAVFFFLAVLLTLALSAFRIIKLARHSNPVVTLYSNPRILNKWGFLYIQYRATGYYFIVPLLAYTFVKGMFVALSQKSGPTQAVALILIEAAALISTSVMRPFMDKSTNSFNIAIFVLNFLNAICLFIFTNVLGMPRMGPSVTGLVVFVANAAFSLILLLMIIVSSVLVFWRKNPDARYQFMADDRASFMKSKSSTQLDTMTQLDALAATARGDPTGHSRPVSRSSSDLAMPVFPMGEPKHYSASSVSSRSPQKDSQVDVRAAER